MNLCNQKANFRVAIFNESSWGGWITVAEPETIGEAKAIADTYKPKYSTSIESLDGQCTCPRCFADSHSSDPE